MNNSWRETCLPSNCVLALVIIGCSGPTGGSGGGGGSGNGGGGGVEVVFDLCESSDGVDDDVDFGEDGMASVVLSTIGEGRHVPLTVDATLVFEFDRPVRLCAITSDNITLHDITANAAVPLTDDALVRTNLVDNDGTVVASRISVILPDTLSAGRDYALTFDSETLSLDGEFQENAGEKSAANGTLPSGDGEPGGDFVQLFRTVSAVNYLTSTRSGTGLALDDEDRLFVLSSTSGVFGPFDSFKNVEEGDQLGGNLGPLAPRTIAVDVDGTVIIKDGLTSNTVFAIDPDSGDVTELGAVGTTSIPDDLIRAPVGYESAERSAVESGDWVFANSGTVRVFDVRSGQGNKGDMNLVDRAGSISDAYVNMFVPGVPDGAYETIYGGYKPEDDTGFEIHRILPNGVIDDSVLTNPSAIAGFSGTAVVRLDDIFGRAEYLIIGQVDTGTVDLRQLVAEDFDGLGVYVYDETRDRLSLLIALPISEFNFGNFGEHSDLVIDSLLENAYLSLPSLETVVQIGGLSNGNDAEGTPACDPSFDDSIDSQLASGNASVYRSTLGNGRHLLRSSPTVLMFDIDQPVPLCAVNSDNIMLFDGAAATSVIPLDDVRIKRQLITDSTNSMELGSRIIIDLPPALRTGSFYTLTLDGEALGLDGEFGESGINGYLPSGDGAPGGDFVQVFQLIEGDYFLNEVGPVVGVDLDENNQLWASNELQIFGPISAPSTPGSLKTINLGSGEIISGTDDDAAGKPMVANDDAALRDVTYASLQDSHLYDADVVGVDSIFQAGLGQVGPGSFEVDLVQSPSGFPGDYIVMNLQRGIAIDSVNDTSATLFTSSSQLFQFKSLSIPPPDVFGTLLLLAANDASTTSFSMLDIGTDGNGETLWTLSGVTGDAGIRINDYEGSAEYLILGDYDESSSSGEIRQITAETSGTELMVYNPGENRLQVIGSFSTGMDMTFNSNLDTVYTSQPDLRAVLRFEGL
ncbi:MAG: NHL repeat-containing protein [Planctomycetota bacterium]|jgi:hypothetical protein